jgi:hypothetical protein
MLLSVGDCGELSDSEDILKQKSIPEAFRADCELNVDIFPNRIFQKQGCYVVIKIENKSNLGKGIRLAISSPLPLYAFIRNPIQKTHEPTSVYLSEWESVQTADGIVVYGVEPRREKILKSWFILKDYDGKNPFGPIFDKPGTYTLYIYGKKFEIEVVEGKSWMADRELTDLFLGSERDVEARKAKLQRILPDYKDPLDQITGHLALGQKEEALKLARQSMPKLAALLVEDADAKNQPEKVETPEQPVPEKKTPTVAGKIRFEYKPAQGDSGTIRTFMTRYVEALRSKNTERMLNLYAWNLAELIGVKKDEEARLWQERFERMRADQPPVVFTAASLEAPTLQDDLPKEFTAKNKTLRVIRMQFAGEGRAPRNAGRILVAEENGELKLVRWAWTANITPYSQRLMNTFGEQLGKSDEISVRKQHPDGTVEETTIRMILMKKAGIPEERRQKVAVKHTSLKPVMESCQLFAYGFELMPNDNPNGAEGRKTHFWVFIIHREPKSWVLHCASTDEQKDVDWDEWEKTGPPFKIELPEPETK